MQHRQMLCYNFIMRLIRDIRLKRHGLRKFLGMRPSSPLRQNNQSNSSSNAGTCWRLAKEVQSWIRLLYKAARVYRSMSTTYDMETKEGWNSESEFDVDWQDDYFFWMMIDYMFSIWAAKSEKLTLPLVVLFYSKYVSDPLSEAQCLHRRVFKTLLL